MKFNSEKIKDPDGKDIIIKEINVKQRQEILKMSEKEIDSLEIDAALIKFGVPDYKELSISDILEFPNSYFSKLAKKIMKMSGLSGGDEEKNS